MARCSECNKFRSTELEVEVTDQVYEEDDKYVEVELELNKLCCYCGIIILQAIKTVIIDDVECPKCGSNGLEADNAEAMEVDYDAKKGIHKIQVSATCTCKKCGEEFETESTITEVDKGSFDEY